MIVNVNVKRADRKKRQVFLFFIFILTLTILSCKMKITRQEMHLVRARRLPGLKTTVLLHLYGDTLILWAVCDQSIFDDTRIFPMDWLQLI